MKFLHLVFCLIISSFSLSLAEKMMVCGESKVIIVNVRNRVDTIAERIWVWDATEAIDLPVVYTKKYFRTIDECKAYDNGTKILITSSSGGVALINRANKKVLFYTYVANAHSAEILPRNRLVVAGSIHTKGSCLELYDLDKSEKLLYRDTLYHGHGVIWNKEAGKLYAIGYHHLNEYKLKNWRTDAPQLDKIKTNTLPSTGGHELQRYKSIDTLICTTDKNVFLFIPKNSTFKPYLPLKNTSHIKSISYNHSNLLMSYTVAEERYWTRRVYFVGSKHFLSFPDLKVYKAHWVQNQVKI